MRGSKKNPPVRAVGQYPLTLLERNVLKQHFDGAMDLCLEAYEVLPDGRSFERSDEDEHAIGVFQNLRDTVDAIPPPLIKATEKLRAVAPGQFEKALADSMRVVRFGFSPGNAAEFVEVLNRTVQSGFAPGVKGPSSGLFRS